MGRKTKAAHASSRAGRLTVPPSSLLNTDITICILSRADVSLYSNKRHWTMQQHCRGMLPCRGGGGGGIVGEMACLGRHTYHGPQIHNATS